MRKIITLKIGKHKVDFLLNIEKGNWTLQHIDSDLMVANGWVADKQFGVRKKEPSLFFIHDALFEKVSKYLSK